MQASCGVGNSWLASLSQQVEQRRAERALAPRPNLGRPSKRDRRKIERFTGNFD